MFWDSVNEAKEDNRELGMNAIEEFLKDKKKVRFTVVIFMILFSFDAFSQSPDLYIYL